MKRNIWIGIGIIVVVALAIVLIVTQTKKEPNEIKIGAILPLTGPSALLGELARNGLTLAEEDINAQGGITRRRLKIILEDGIADPNSSISAFRKLIIIDKVKFVITTHSSVGLALSPLADKEKVVLFVHASHPQITGMSPYVFRHSNIAEQESQIIVDFVNKQNKKNYALAVMDDDYGMVFREKLKQIFLEYKILMASDIIYEKTETDFKTIAQKLLANKNPDIVIIAGLGNGVGLLIRRLKEMGYKGNVLITLGSAVTGAFQGAGEARKGAFYVDLDINTEETRYKELNEKYSRQFKEDITSSSLLFYNSVFILAKAIENSGVNPDVVSKFLGGLRSFEGVGERVQILNRRDIIPTLKVIQRQ